MTRARGRTKAASVAATLAAAAGTAWGLALVVQPERILTALDGETAPDPALVAGARVLGVRHVVQAIVLVRRPNLAARWGIGIDVAHAVSMLGLAAVDHRRRRAELVSAAVSLALGITSFAGRP
jgi:hypothetical protein